MEVHFQSMIMFIILLISLVFVNFALFNYVIKFKVDVQEIGQEEFDRYILVNKILNAKGCTLGEGIFLYDKVKEPNEFCQFKECKIEGNLNWGYILISEELNLDTRKGKLCRRDDMPKFKFEQSIPVLIYKDGIYYPGNMIIFGPQGIITASLSTNRIEKGVIENFYFRDENKNAETLEFSSSFECDVPKNAECSLSSIKSSAQIKMGFLGIGNKEAKFEVEVNGKIYRGGNYKKESEGFFTLHRKWTSIANLKDEVKLFSGDKADIKMRWIYGKKTHFGKVKATLYYKVICPVGYVADKIFKKGKVVFLCKEEKIGEEIE